MQSLYFGVIASYLVIAVPSFFVELPLGEGLPDVRPIVKKPNKLGAKSLLSFLVT
jgi:hypothetical protein